MILTACAHIPLDPTTKREMQQAPGDTHRPNTVPGVFSLATAQRASHFSLEAMAGFIHSFFHSISKCLLSISYVLSIVLGTGDGAVNKTDESLVMEDRR